MNGESSPRIGVFICECGGKIGNVIDLEMLRRQALQIPGVAFAARDAYPCSKGGQDRIRQAIEEQKLERILIAGCAPRLVEKLFRQAVQPAIEPDYVDIANIREQAAFVQANAEMRLSLASDLIAMGVARLATIMAASPHSERVVKSALVIGSSLSAMTAALALAEGGNSVTLVVKTGSLNDSASGLQEQTRQLMGEKSRAVLQHPMISTLFNASIVDVTGHPGEYDVSIQSGDQSSTCSFGVIIIDNAAQPKAPDSSCGLDRTRVKTQAEFEQELENAAGPGTLDVKNIVMIFCAEETQRTRCSRGCCNTGILQAIRARQLNPEANVTILFRELYFGSLNHAFESVYKEAQKLGVTFFRYRGEHPPVISDGTVAIYDTLTGAPVQVPFDRAVLTASLVPQDNGTLAALFGLPQDEAGFLTEPRLRLRPGHYAESGIYVLGSAWQPADDDEALFQAYLTSARAGHFLSQENITSVSAVISIDPELCTGCGNCPQVCPTRAIHLEKQSGILSLSVVDEMCCIGCGNCVVVCPVKAIHLPGWDDTAFPAQISAALRTPKDGKPKVVALACEWSAYGAADVAGTRHIPYPSGLRILRMNCSARFDPYHILWAFLNGADGVFLGACPPGECHYGSGNLYASERIAALRTELKAYGVNPCRLHLEYLTVEDGKKFAEAVTAFVDEVSFLPLKDS